MYENFFFFRSFVLDALERDHRFVGHRNLENILFLGASSVKCTVQNVTKCSKFSELKLLLLKDILTWSNI